MRPLRLGAVKPSGWIQAQMRRDFSSGIVGYFNWLRPEFDIYIYTERKGAANHGEMTGNWLDGYIRTAFLIEDREGIARVDRMVQEILDSADPDGYLGSFPPDKRFRNAITGELMMQSHLYVALLAYYELTGIEEVLKAVIKATRLTISKYPLGSSLFSPRVEVKRQTVKDHNKLKDVDIEERRAGWVDHSLVFTDVLEWLYRLTGDQVFVEFGIRMYQDFSTSSMVVMRDIKLGDVLNEKRPFFWHGVHVAEHLRTPTWLSTVVQEETYKKAAAAGYKKLLQHITPSGSLASDEHVRNQPGYCDRAYEYCTTTQLTESLAHRLRQSGDATYADMTENIVFNAGQASRTPDGKNIHYLTRDTQFSATEQRHNGRRKLSPAHEIGNSCCSANAVRLMPCYVSSMWARQGDGLVALLYGPCVIETEVSGTRVKIEEKTEYPFSTRVEFVFTVEKPVHFAFYFREPSWETGGISIKAPEGEISREGDFFELTRTWRSGDRVTLCFEPLVIIQKLSNGEGVVRRGPLVFALPLPYRMNTLPRKHSVPGFYDYEVLPVSEYVNNENFIDNHAGAYSFSTVVDDDADMEDPWSNPPVCLEGELCSPSHFDSGMRSRCTLIPLGCSILRVASFPLWPFEDTDLELNQ